MLCDARSPFVILKDLEGQAATSRPESTFEATAIALALDGNAVPATLPTT